MRKTFQGLMAHWLQGHKGGAWPGVLKTIMMFTLMWKTWISINVQVFLAQWKNPIFKVEGQ